MNIWFYFYNACHNTPTNKNTADCVVKIRIYAVCCWKLSVMKRLSSEKKVKRLFLQGCKKYLFVFIDQSSISLKNIWEAMGGHFVTDSNPPPPPKKKKKKKKKKNNAELRAPFGWKCNLILGIICCVLLLWYIIVVIIFVNMENIYSTTVSYLFHL